VGRNGAQGSGHQLRANTPGKIQVSWNKNEGKDQEKITGGEKYLQFASDKKKECKKVHQTV